MLSRMQILFAFSSTQQKSPAQQKRRNRFRPRKGVRNPRIHFNRIRSENHRMHPGKKPSHAGFVTPWPARRKKKDARDEFASSRELLIQRRSQSLGSCRTSDTSSSFEACLVHFNDRGETFMQFYESLSKVSIVMSSDIFRVCWPMKSLDVYPR
jgi:hypothetical protein